MDLIVKPSKIGLGAFATKPFEKDQVIIDWSDHPLFALPPRIPSDWKFTQISPGVLVGPVGSEKYPDAYINHSCEPNARILYARPKIELVALQAVRQGEEITFDYATLYRRPWSMKCICGSSSCRRMIRGH